MAHLTMICMANNMGQYLRTSWLENTVCIIYLYMLHVLRNITNFHTCLVTAQFNFFANI